MAGLKTGDGKMFRNENAKNFRIAAKTAARWARLTDCNDHARVDSEMVAHMARGVKKSCGGDSRAYAEIAALAVNARGVLEYRDRHGGLCGEMAYLGWMYVKMAKAIVSCVADAECAEAYDRACNGEIVYGNWKKCS